MDTRLLIARPSRGLDIGVHAVQKLLGWLGGEGLKGTGGSLGFWPGVLFAMAAGLGEAGGGLLTAAGFLGAVSPALIILVMLVAIFTVHWGHGSFAASYGLETGLSPERAWVAIVAVVVAFACLALPRVAPGPARTYA